MRTVECGKCELTWSRADANEHCPRCEAKQNAARADNAEKNLRGANTGNVRLKAENERLRKALQDLGLDEALTFEGNMEAKIYCSVDALNAARAALEGKETP